MMMEVPDILDELKASSLTRQVLWTIWKNQRIRPKQIGIVLEEWGKTVVYSRLRKLEQMGLVSATERSKRFSLYELTQQGMKVVDRLIREGVPPFKPYATDQIPNISIEQGRTESLYDEGNQYYEWGEYEKAIHLHSEAIDNSRLSNPGLYKYFYSRGWARILLEKYPEAISDLLKVVDLKPDFAEGYNALGICREYTEDLDEAITMYKKALQFNPDLSDAKNRLEICEYKKTKQGELSRFEMATKAMLLSLSRKEERMHHNQSSRVNASLDLDKISIRANGFFKNSYVIDIPLVDTPDNAWQCIFEHEWKTSMDIWDRKFFFARDKLRLVTDGHDIEEKLAWVKFVVEETNRKYG